VNGQAGGGTLQAEMLSLFPIDGNTLKWGIYAMFIGWLMWSIAAVVGERRRG
jgi:hypothetical protein